MCSPNIGEKQHTWQHCLLINMHAGNLYMGLTFISQHLTDDIELCENYEKQRANKTRH